MNLPKKGPYSKEITMHTRVVDLVEAAVQLRVTYQKVYRLVISGRLKGERRDGRWFVDSADLDRLVSESDKVDKNPAPAR